MPHMLGELRIEQIIGTIFYGFLGIGLFMLAYMAIEKVCPFSVKKEISEDQNIALGIIIGSVMIGLSMIISASIKG